MTGLVTTEFRVTNAKQYVEMFSEAEDNIYFFVSKNTPWIDPASGQPDDNNPPNPVESKFDLRNVWSQMIALKKLLPSDVSLGLHRYDWTVGTVYDQYDDLDGFMHFKKWYVMNSQNQVFACLNNGKSLTGGAYQGATSTFEPFYDGTIPSVTVFNTPDGYTWKYMYTVPFGDFLKFTTPSWMPCVSTEDPSQASTGIYSISLTQFGLGYSLSDCTITIDGDGSGATAIPVISGGQITKITITNPGSGYTYANVTIGGTNTTPAEARAICFNRNGIGARPAFDLGAYFVVNSVALEYGENGLIPTYNEYRQFGLLRNPILVDGITVASGTIYNMIYRVKVTSPDLFVQDEVVSVNGGTAMVIHYETPWPDQYLTLGGATASIGVGDVITSGTKSATVVEVLDEPDLIYGSGDILYLENTTPVYRNSNQQEQFVLVNEW